MKKMYEKIRKFLVILMSFQCLLQKSPRKVFGRAAIMLILSLVLLVSCADPKQVPLYTQRLRSTKASERNEAALWLGRIGSPAADNAVPQLIALLSDENTGVQSSAAYALRKIDTPQARKALEAVRRFKR